MRTTPATTKPCPFCGHGATVEPWHGGGPNKHVVMCGNESCNARPMVNGESKSAAVRQWNRRAP